MSNYIKKAMIREIHTKIIGPACANWITNESSLHATFPNSGKNKILKLKKWGTHCPSMR